jgi:acetylornithine deacetylase/succinyl-diaminopimelate desuccinylase-like protein
VFGMRGVVYANLAVSTARDDAHSGVDGGIVAEPMFDMVRVLGAIADSNGVKLPGFCEWFIERPRWIRIFRRSRDPRCGPIGELPSTSDNRICNVSLQSNRPLRLASPILAKRLTIPPTPVPADCVDDNVSPPTPDETKLLEDVAKSCGRSVDDLVKVWRQPSFSIANISSSGVSNKTVIPKKVSADISMRIVPEQVGGALRVPEDLVSRRWA